MIKFFIPVFLIAGLSAGCAHVSKQRGPASLQPAKIKKSERQKASPPSAALPEMQSRAPSQASSDSLSKDFFLPETYYEPKKSHEQLARELEIHLESLSEVCRLPENKEEILIARLESLASFLENSLSDPYMSYRHTLTFGDMLSLLSFPLEGALADPEDFRLSYRLLYNVQVSEEEEADSLPDKWARDIYQALRCAQKERAAAAKAGEAP